MRAWMWYCGASATFLLAALVYPSQSLQSLLLTGCFMLVTVGSIVGLVRQK